MSIYGRSPKVSQVARYISNLWENNLSSFFISTSNMFDKEKYETVYDLEFLCLRATCWYFYIKRLFRTLAGLILGTLPCKLWETHQAETRECEG
jgi:hypothetical protein